MKVAICTPTITDPFPAYLDALHDSLPALSDTPFASPTWIVERGNPYISAARATMLRKALDGGADIIVFIDHDLSWDPQDLLTLIETPGDVVAGLYRFKRTEPDYMGELICDAAGRPMGQHAEGTETLVLRAKWVPAGFLKVTRAAVAHFMRAYPHLCYGDPIAPHVDIFNHGAHEGTWYGEDVAFSRNWRASGGDIWVIPDLNLTHHATDKAFPGNYHHYLRRQPGGVLDPARSAAA